MGKLSKSKKYYQAELELNIDNENGSANLDSLDSLNLMEVDRQISDSLRIYNKVQSNYTLDKVIEDIGLRLKRTALDTYIIGHHLSISLDYLKESGNTDDINKFWDKVERKTNMSKQNLKAYINVYQRFSQKDVEQLSKAGCSETSIKLLAGAQTPQVIREEAVELAMEGETITTEIAKELTINGKKEAKDWDEPPKRRKTTPRNNERIVTVVSKPVEEESVENIHPEVAARIKDEFIPKWSTRYASGSVRQKAINQVLESLIKLINNEDDDEDN